MKRCLVCQAKYDFSLAACSSCGHKVILVDGFECYAAAFAHGGGGFKSEYFSNLILLEEANFWFQSRNKLILWALEKYCQNFKSLLEIGCGTAYVLSGISKAYPQSKLFGSEIFIAGLDFAALRVPTANFMQMDARNLPYMDEYDVIGAFDVLEHIEEDERTLAQFRAALKPNGFMLLTVPQHEWLWSPLDEYACHVRRYTASGLHQKIEAAGFQIVRSTSYVTTLLPAMMLSRFFHKKEFDESFDAAAELKIAPWLNTLFLQFLRLELALIKKGFNFSVGGSRLVVAKKI